MAYKTIMNPPSSYIPYPEGTVIKCRPVTYGEVRDFSELEGSELDIINLFKENEIIVCEGIEFEDITVGDWMYFLLSIMSTSFLRITYNVSRTCPDCKGEIQTIDLQIPGTSPIEVKGDMQAKVTPAEIVFRQITNEDIPELPIVVELENGNETEIDFFRMKHYFETLKNDKADEIALITTADPRKLTLDDISVVSYARELMEHGPESDVEAKCPVCGKTDTVHVEWEGISFVPFRPDERSTKNRIRFGKRTESTMGKSKKNTVSSNSGSVPKLNKVSEQDS